MRPSRQHDNHDSLAMLPWYPRDWRASTARAVMSALARGIYRELLDAAWLDGGSLPSDERTLIALAGCTAQEWRKAGQEVLAEFSVGDDGRLRQDRLSWQHERAAELRDKQRKAALTATEARQRKLDTAHGDRNGDRDAQRVGDRNGDRTPPTPSPSPSPTPTPTPAPKEERTPAPAAPRAVSKPATEKREGWTAEAGEDYEARFGGAAPFPLIGKCLKPLVDKHGWDVVRPVWRHYLAVKDPDFAKPADFAQKFGHWQDDLLHGGNGNGAKKGTVGQRTMDTARKVLADLERGRGLGDLFSPEDIDRASAAVKPRLVEEIR